MNKRAFRRTRRRAARLLAVRALFTLCLSAELLSEQGPSQRYPFLESAQQVGLNFTHFIGATGEFFLPENMGSGVALIDYDNDGDLDVYFLQGALLDPQKQLADSRFPTPEAPPRNRLFRNQLTEKGTLTYTDVTQTAGVGDTGYGMGAAVGDYDNDGDLDLYVTNFGANVLYRNNGDGTFATAKGAAGANDSRWSTSASFFDYDRDGDLDLFVTNYVDFTVKGNRPCASPVGERDYCAPSVYQPLPDRLFRNQGDGSFSDVSLQAGIGAAFGRGLGASCTDFDGDGWIDIYVANDGSANQLWLNQGNGTFEDVALLAGAAYNGEGAAEAGMGVATGDCDNDGDEDIFVTHLNHESHTLYRNEGRFDFRDVTIQSGLGAIRNYTGFGTEWFDYDNDGWLDLFVANGAVYLIPSQRHEPYPYHEVNQLFHNRADGRFEDATRQAGQALGLSEVSRGAAFGDIDNDGDVDIVVANNNGSARLLLNQSFGHHWLLVGLEGVQSNRHGIGARVGLFRQGRKPLWRRVHSDGSYLSAGDLRVHFGLGPRSDQKSIVVQWPGGRIERWSELEADRILTLREGSGDPWSGNP